MSSVGTDLSRPAGLWIADEDVINRSLQAISFDKNHYLLNNNAKAMMITIAIIIPTMNEKRLFFFSSSVGGTFSLCSLISSLSFLSIDVAQQR